MMQLVLEFRVKVNYVAIQLGGEWRQDHQQRGSPSHLSANNSCRT